jgi:hypothetical protein
MGCIRLSPRVATPRGIGDAATSLQSCSEGKDLFESQASLEGTWMHQRPCTSSPTKHHVSPWGTVFAAGSGFAITCSGSAWGISSGKIVADLTVLLEPPYCLNTNRPAVAIATTISIKTHVRTEDVAAEGGTGLSTEFMTDIADTVALDDILLRVGKVVPQDA